MINVDLADIDGFWGRSIEYRHAAFAQLRRENPVPFCAEPDLGYGERGPGFFAVTRFDDVVTASRNPETFRSAPHASGIADIPPAVEKYFATSLMNQDAPGHTRLRRIVSRAFTPRRVGELRGTIQRIAQVIVDDVVRRGECDVPGDISAQMPLRVVCELLGVPGSHYGFVLHHTNVLLGLDDPEFTGGDVMAALTDAAEGLSVLINDLAAARRRHPQDDVISELVCTAADDRALTEEELGAFFVLLAAAGNETARNAISWGIKLLTDNPDQRSIWLADIDAITPTAVDEILRWSSPVMFTRRTLAAPARLSDVDLPAGSKVLLYYWSANRDERVFAEPEKFLVGRKPNPHIAFGGNGPHFCLGVHLARAEMSAMFTEILRRAPGIRVGGEPQLLRSLFMNGIKRMPCSLS